MNTAVIAGIGFLVLAPAPFLADMFGLLVAGLPPAVVGIVLVAKGLRERSEAGAR